MALDWSFPEIRTTVIQEIARLAREKYVYPEMGLFYGHQDFPESWKLVPMAETRFRLDEDMKFEFLMDQDGRASAAKIYYCDGRPEVIATRTG